MSDVMEETAAPRAHARVVYLPIHEAREGTRNGTPRRAGVSAYGFGGTNFHLVMDAGGWARARGC